MTIHTPCGQQIPNGETGGHCPGCPHCGGGPWRHVRDLPNGSVIVQCRECKAATDLKEWEA